MFSFMAMTLGVAALILVLSVMNGFRQELSGRFLDVLPHATLFSNHAIDSELQIDEQLQSLESLAYVKAVSPVLEDIAMLSVDGVQTMANLTGIDAEADALVVPIDSTLIDGNWQDFVSQRFTILLGAQVARKLGVHVGDSVRVTLPTFQVTPTGIYPRVRNFRVAGTFSSRSQLDNELAFIRYEDAQPLFQGVAARRGMRVALTDPDRSLMLLEKVFADGNIEIIPWQARLNGLYEAMQLEKTVVGLMLVAIIFIAAFSLVASLMMSVAEKRTDVAVLRTMGASSETILGVFLLQGLLFGGLGVLLGALFGTVATIYLSEVVAFIERISQFSLFDPTVFYVAFLPTQLRMSDLLWIVICALGITVLASVVPAWQASRVAPAEAIHYNH